MCEIIAITALCVIGISIVVCLIAEARLEDQERELEFDKVLKELSRK